MAVYYYTPFADTDDNDRVTWNMFNSWGVKFADCRGSDGCAPGPRNTGSSTPRKYLSPAELADKLLADGLENRAFNLILVCCYGAGFLPDEEGEARKKGWQGIPQAEQAYGGWCLAQSLAKALGRKLSTLKPLPRGGAPFKVCGFLGPTYTKGGSIEVTVDNQKKIRAPAWGFDRWFDSAGGSSQPNPEDIGPPSHGSIPDLTDIQAGDELLIMAHGDWKMGGMLLPFAGPTMEKFMSKPVNRAERLAGRDARL